VSSGWNTGLKTGVKTGNVPTERIAPILYTLIRERWPHGGGLEVLSEKVGCDATAIAGIIDKQNEGVAFDLADRLLCALGRWDIWHGELEDIYPTKFIETCALPSCNKTFPERRSGPHIKRYCSYRCMDLGRQVKAGRATGERLRQRGYCLKGHKLNGQRQCVICRREQRKRRKGDTAYLEHVRQQQREWRREKMADPAYRAEVNRRRRERRAAASAD
jgi:hypothetical protein